MFSYQPFSCCGRLNITLEYKNKFYFKVCSLKLLLIEGYKWKSILSLNTYYKHTLKLQLCLHNLNKIMPLCVYCVYVLVIFRWAARVLVNSKEACEHGIKVNKLLSSFFSF